MIIAPQDGTENAPRSLQEASKAVLKSYFFDVHFRLRFWSVLGPILVAFWEPKSSILGSMFDLFWGASPQEASKRPPRAPKRRQQAPKGAPRSPQEAPKRPQEIPKRPQETPKRPPRGVQDAPERPQEAPKTPRDNISRSGNPPTT